MACPTPVSEAERQCGQRGVGRVTISFAVSRDQFGLSVETEHRERAESGNDQVSLERAKHTLPHFEESL